MRVWSLDGELVRTVELPLTLNDRGIEGIAANQDKIFFAYNGEDEDGFIHDSISCLDLETGVVQHIKFLVGQGGQ